ncbi:hypothetical protein [Marinicrinis lubricantis]|uniref:Uncharacterized protein n=1 Tax=Marinicrinis lubricantis TaxID=2086470 RepID=A0ABW1ITN4_9BACL
MEQIFAVISQNIASMEEVKGLSDSLIDAAEQVNTEIATLEGLSQSLQQKFEDTSEPKNADVESE